MGRIKTAMVKRATRQLLEGENPFNDKFDHNKKILGRTMPSKPVRNKIAGYMARIIRAKNTEKAKVPAKAIEISQ